MRRYKIYYRMVTKTKKLIWRKVKTEEMVEEIEGSLKTLKRYHHLKEREDVLSNSITIRENDRLVDESTLASRAIDEMCSDTNDLIPGRKDIIERKLTYGVKGIKIFAVKFEEEGLSIEIYDISKFINLIETNKDFNKSIKLFNSCVDIGECENITSLRIKLVKDCFSSVVEAGIIEVM